MEGKEQGKTRKAWEHSLCGCWLIQDLLNWLRACCLIVGLSASPLVQILDTRSASVETYLQLGPTPLHPPDTTHMMNPTTQFCHSSTSCTHNLKNREWGRSGNEAGLLLSSVYPSTAGHKVMPCPIHCQQWTAMYAHHLNSCSGLKNLHSFDVPGRVEEWHIPRKTTSEWVHYWSQTQTIKQLSTRHQTVFVMFLRFRKPLYSCTEGMCHSSTHLGMSMHVISFRLPPR